MASSQLSLTPKSIPSQNLSISLVFFLGCIMGQRSHLAVDNPSLLKLTHRHSFPFHLFAPLMDTGTSEVFLNCT